MGWEQRQQWEAAAAGSSDGCAWMAVVAWAHAGWEGCICSWPCDSCRACMLVMQAAGHGPANSFYVCVALLVGVGPVGKVYGRAVMGLHLGAVQQAAATGTDRSWKAEERLGMTTHGRELVLRSVSRPQSKCHSTCDIPLCHQLLSPCLLIGACSALRNCHAARQRAPPQPFGRLECPSVHSCAVCQELHAANQHSSASQQASLGLVDRHRSLCALFLPCHQQTARLLNHPVNP